MVVTHLLSRNMGKRGTGTGALLCRVKLHAGKAPLEAPLTSFELFTPSSPPRISRILSWLAILRQMLPVRRFNDNLS